MRTLRSLIAIAFVAASPAITAASEDDVAPCKNRLTPLHTVAPDLPRRLHNEFRGKAIVSYIVDANGQVRFPTVVSSEWHPVGRSAGQPVGYTEAVLAAVSLWKFAPQTYACRNQTSVDFNWE